MARARGIPMALGGRHGFTAAVSHVDSGDDGESGNGASEIGALAIEFLRAVLEADDGSGPRFAFGIHTGPAVAAVIGDERLRFDLWGDAVETATRLASAAEPGRILVSPAARSRLAEDFVMEPGRVVEVAGLGQIRPHVLIDEKGALDAPQV
jgi:class 3 adenylate cyclase